MNESRSSHSFLHSCKMSGSGAPNPWRAYTYDTFGKDCGASPRGGGGGTVILTGVCRYQFQNGGGGGLRSGKEDQNDGLENGLPQKTTTTTQNESLLYTPLHP